MSIACKTTPEQKTFIFDKYYDLLQNLGGYTIKIDNYSSKPNTYVSHIDGEIGQTSREPLDSDAENYFIWEDYNTFITRLTNLLIKKQKIKV